MKTLREGDTGSDVEALQRKLVERGYPVGVDGDFSANTSAAVRAFQSQNLDSNGAPLVFDGTVGPLTWWSLRNSKPFAQTIASVDFTRLPEASFGGSALGRATLQVAIDELKAGAGEIGGDNRGPFVKKYLPAGVPEGSSWCASFVSWCAQQASARTGVAMPFKYSAGARAILADFTTKGWGKAPETAYEPKPGDLVFWWRVRFDAWQGHVGFVHHVKDGQLYTIEGNHSPKVEGFSYVLGRMDKLLGFGSIP